MESISEAELVPMEIAPVVGFSEIRSASNLINYLKNKSFLLVIDNFEHVIEASDFIKKLCNKCPNLRFLITSQNKLGLDEEQEIELPTLGFPDAAQSLAPVEDLKMNFSSVALFNDRAIAVNNSFELTATNSKYVAEICLRAGGLPLAIEIIAAHIKLFQADQILNSLKTSGYLSNKNKRNTLLDLHETIEETISWSYAHLEEEIKKLFRFLSVFEGGVSLNILLSIFNRMKNVNENTAGKARILPPDTILEEAIELLIAKRLLRRVNDYPFDQPRFSMLNTVRLFALGRLKINGEFNAIRRFHALYFITLAEEADTKLTSRERDSGHWLEKLGFEYENLRAVLEWCSDGENYDLGLRLAGALFWYWNLKGHFSEGRRWLNTLIHSERKTENPEYYAKALYAAGGLAFLQSDYKFAEKILTESVTLWRELFSKGNIGAERRLGYALIILGMIELNQNHLKQARNLLQESKDIFLTINDEWGKALAINDFGRVLEAEGNFKEAESHYKASLSLWQQMGDKWGQPLTLHCLGSLACRNKDYNGALEYLEAALKLLNQKNQWLRALLLQEFGNVHYEQGKQKAQGDYRNAKDEYIAAIINYRNSLSLHLEMGRKQLVAECFEGLSRIAIDLNEPVEGAVLSGSAERIRNETNARLTTLQSNNNEKHKQNLKEIIGEHQFEKKWSIEYKMTTTEQAVEKATEDTSRWIDDLSH